MDLVVFLSALLMTNSYQVEIAGWQSTEGGGVIILLDALSQMQKSMAKLRCIDKRLIKGMPFYANINAFSLMATQIEVVMRVLSSPEAVPADADSSVSEVAW